MPSADGEAVVGVRKSPVASDVAGVMVMAVVAETAGRPSVREVLAIAA